MSSKETIYESGLVHVYIDFIKTNDEFVECVFIDSQNICSIVDDTECASIPVDSVEGKLIINSFEKLGGDVRICSGGQGRAGYAAAIVTGDFIEGDKDDTTRNS